jgi:hypothetical protein
MAINDPGPPQAAGPGAPAGNAAKPKGYTNQKLSMPEIAYHVKQYWNVPAFNKEANPVIAIAVAMAESSGNTNPPTAPPGMFGLFQINMNGSIGTERRRKYNLPKNEELYIATTNTRVAWGIWREAGNSWKPWEAYTNGAYKQYIDQAFEAYKNPKQPGNVQQGEVVTTIPFLEDLKEWISGGVLRAATFIGGGALLIFAIVMLVKKGVK